MLEQSICVRLRKSENEDFRRYSMGTLTTDSIFQSHESGRRLRLLPLIRMDDFSILETTLVLEPVVCL